MGWSVMGWSVMVVVFHQGGLMWVICRGVVCHEGGLSWR